MFLSILVLFIAIFNKYSYGNFDSVSFIELKKKIFSSKFQVEFPLNDVATGFEEVPPGGYINSKKNSLKNKSFISCQMNQRFQIWYLAVPALVCSLFSLIILFLILNNLVSPCCCKKLSSFDIEIERNEM